MSGMNISEFVGNLSNGLASPNKYRVTFFPPGQNSGDRTISLMCNVSELPGRAIHTVENRHYNNPFRLPYAAQYNNINFSFVNTNGLPEREFFETWQEKVIDPTSGLIGFRDDFTGTIKIAVLNSGTGEEAYVVQLIRAYPLNINEVGMGYSMQNETLVSSISFTYQYWTRT